MQKPSSVTPIAIAVLAVGGLVFANVMANKNRPKTSAELEQEEKAAQEKQATPAPQIPLGGAKGMGDPNPTDLKASNDLAALGPDVILPGGDRNKPVIVGYEWTPELQADASPLVKFVEKVRAETPDAQIRLTNVDEMPNTPRGVSVGNKIVAPLGPDGNLGATAADAAIAQIKNNR